MARITHVPHTALIKPVHRKRYITTANLIDVFSPRRTELAVNPFRPLLLIFALIINVVDVVGVVSLGTVFEVVGRTEEANLQLIDFIYVAEKEKEAAKAQEDKTAKVRLNEKRRMSFKEKREFEQLEQEIADLETEKNAIEEALCSGTLSVDELTEKSKRLPELSDLIDEKTLRWLELSEIKSN